MKKIVFPSSLDLLAKWYLNNTQHPPWKANDQKRGYFGQNSILGIINDNIQYSIVEGLTCYRVKSMVDGNRHSLVIRDATIDDTGEYAAEIEGYKTTSKVSVTEGMKSFIYVCHATTYQTVLIFLCFVLNFALIQSIVFSRRSFFYDFYEGCTGTTKCSPAGPKFRCISNF